MSKNILIAGGTSGIGRGIAEYYASTYPDSKITIIGRNAQAASEISQAFPNISFISLDATIMSDIKKCTAEFKQTCNKLDILILSQGGIDFAGRTETKEGIDKKFALAYYGRMLFIRELLPIIPEDGRVLLILNSKQGNPDKVVWDDMDLKHNYGLLNSFNHSTTFHNIMVQWFSKNNPTVHFTHAYPGYVDTPIGNNFPWYLRMFTVPMKIFSISPQTCAPFMVKALEETKGWRRADEKGNTIEREPVSEEMADKLAQHTWQIIDNVPSS